MLFNISFNKRPSATILNASNETIISGYYIKKKNKYPLRHGNRKKA